MTQEYTMPKLIEAIIETYLDRLHTCVPAKIVSYNHGSQKATVQPTIKYRDREASGKGLVDMPMIVGVPVVFPSASFGILTFPIRAGDDVILIFSERSLDNYLYTDSSKSVDPDDLRKHNYTDAIAIVGMSTFPNALGSHPDDTVLRMNANKPNEVSVSLKPNGDLVIDSPNKVIINSASNIEINVGGNAIINVSGETTLTSTSTTINSPTEINGNVVVNGDISCSQTITAATDVLGGGKSLKTHKHLGVTPGGGLSGMPQ